MGSEPQFPVNLVTVERVLLSFGCGGPGGEGQDCILSLLTIFDISREEYPGDARRKAALAVRVTRL